MKAAAEEWRDIPGSRGRYQVSSHGRVRSTDRIVLCADGVERPWPGRILKTFPVNRAGDRMLTLALVEGERRNYFVHDLMQRAFG